MASSTNVQPRVLLALDCDHTIIDDNSDTWIRALLPKRKVPEPITQRYKNEHNSWTIYMGETFEYMHSLNITEGALRASIADIPLCPGMKALLEYQNSSSHVDAIVISDSNSFFIDVILRTRNFHEGMSRIYTNQAEFDADGCLKIHFSNPHNCPRKCPQNLCKATSLHAFLAEQKAKGIAYDYVCMIGDGRNDLCPCFGLREQDFVFPRRGYSLIKLLAAKEQETVKATVVPWTSATEILDVIKGLGCE